MIQENLKGVGLLIVIVSIAILLYILCFGGRRKLQEMEEQQVETVGEEELVNKNGITKEFMSLLSLNKLNDVLSPSSLEVYRKEKNESRFGLCVWTVLTLLSLSTLGFSILMGYPKKLAVLIILILIISIYKLYSVIKGRKSRKRITALQRLQEEYYESKE